MSDLRLRIERQRHEETRTTPRVEHKPGKASDYLHHLPELLRRSKRPVVLYCRESTEGQVEAGNLDDQIADARSDLRALGARLLRVFDTPEGESSSIYEHREYLKQAIAFAKEHGAILVAASRDRFIRSSGFDGNKETEAPTDVEYLELVRLADGVPLATIEHPDSTAARSKQTIRGQTAKDRKGGRPLSKKERNRRAAEMKRAGASHAEIASTFRAPRSTAQYWTKGVRKGVRKTDVDQSNDETH